MDTSALATARQTAKETRVGATVDTTTTPGFGWFSLLLAAGAGFALGSWNRNPLEGPKHFAEDTSKGIGKLHQKIEERRARR